MFEGEFVSVKHLTRRRVAGQFGQPFVLSVAISRVADDRKAEMFEMNANPVLLTKAITVFVNLNRILAECSL